MQDARFIRAYDAGFATGSWTHHIYWRAYVNCWAAECASRLAGDFVECGVYKGGYARMIVDYVDFERLGKRYWLVDTYEGFAEDQLSMAERAAMGGGTGLYDSRGHYPDAYAQVQATFRAFPSVQAVKGAVPGVLPQIAASRIAYLSLDMNNAKPERLAIEFLWDRLVPGALVVLDDYGFMGHGEQKIALDEFAGSRTVPILALPTGQGLMVKAGDRLS